MSTVNWLAFMVQIAIMLLFPIGLAVYFRRRFHVSWVVFFIAATFYLINLVVQSPFLFAWYYLFSKLPWISLALITLTYAVCEETMRYLSFRVGRVMRANRTANGALMAGVGHGGAESIVFALGAIFTLVTALYMPLSLGGAAQYVLNAPWWTYILTGFSRILAITVHLGFATLIVLAYRRTWHFYPIAILAHFLVDFSTFGVQNLTRSALWTIAVFILWAIAAVLLLLRVRRTDVVEPSSVQVGVPGVPA